MFCIFFIKGPSWSNEDTEVFQNLSGSGKWVALFARNIGEQTVNCETFPIIELVQMEGRVRSTSYKLMFYKKTLWRSVFFNIYDCVFKCQSNKSLSPVVSFFAKEEIKKSNYLQRSTKGNTLSCLPS